MKKRLIASLGGMRVPDNVDWFPLYYGEGLNRQLIGKARIVNGQIEMEIDKKEKVMTDTTDTPQEPIWPTGTPLPEGVEATQLVTETLLSQSEIQERFGFHKASIEGPSATTEIHKDLRFAFMQFADYLNNRLGKSRNAALAQTALEEASMWSHKAIAAADPIDPEA